ncbi:MAG: hypothetical protein AAF682_00405 [Planctomycetota bacterium]
MHPALPLLSSAACGAATAWLVVSLHAPAASAAPAQPASSPSVADARVSAELMELRQSVEELRLRPTAAATGARKAAEPELSLQEVEEAVRRLVAAEALAEAPAEGEEPTVAWPGETDGALAAVLRILELGVDSPEAQALWAEAAENGQLHALLDAMEAHLGETETVESELARARSYYSAARADPWNKDGNWWVDSNDAYGRVLDLDPQHWEARYNKARNMSFWPAAYGGQAEAIKHFEILIDQQESGAPADRYARTYLWLGNLYAQQGNASLANDVWNRGLQLYPGDSSLAEKLALLGD